MHDAVDILAEAAATEDPALVFSVTQQAIASAIKVILRADDPVGSSATPPAPTDAAR